MSFVTSTHAHVFGHFSSTQIPNRKRRQMVNERNTNVTNGPMHLRDTTKLVLILINASKSRYLHYTCIVYVYQCRGNKLNQFSFLRMKVCHQQPVPNLNLCMREHPYTRGYTFLPPATAIIRNVCIEITPIFVSDGATKRKQNINYIISRYQVSLK